MCSGYGWKTRFFGLGRKHDFFMLPGRPEFLVSRKNVIFQFWGVNAIFRLRRENTNFLFWKKMWLSNLGRKTPFSVGVEMRFSGFVEKMRFCWWKNTFLKFWWENLIFDFNVKMWFFSFGRKTRFFNWKCNIIVIITNIVNFIFVLMVFKSFGFWDANVDIID